MTRENAQQYLDNEISILTSYGQKHPWGALIEGK
jgi:hypothetical protein